MCARSDDGSPGGSNKIIRLIRLFKLLKLLRVAKIARIVDKYEEELFHIASGLGLIKIVILMGAAGHWLTCMWYFCGAVQTADVDRCVNSPPSKPLQSNLSLCRGGASSFSVSNDCLSPHIWLSRIWNTGACTINRPLITMHD